MQKSDYPIIKKGQVYKSWQNNSYILIDGKKDAKWLAKVLTDKPGVFNGSHKMAERTLHKHYTLCQ